MTTFTHFTHPSLLPLATTNLFSVSMISVFLFVGLLQFHMQLSCMQFAVLWLISLSIMPSRHNVFHPYCCKWQDFPICYGWIIYILYSIYIKYIIHIIYYIVCFIYTLTIEIYIIYTYIYLSTHLSMELSCFSVLAIVNNATINMGFIYFLVDVFVSFK